MNKDSVQFNRIVFDRKRKKIHLWHTINGTRFHDEEDYTWKYYVPDPSGQSEITDLNGTPVKACYSNNKYELSALIDAVGYQNIHEADMAEDITFLHSKYEHSKLTVDMDNINVCYIDIETSAEDEFTHPDQAAYPINLITCHFTGSNRTVTWGLYEYSGGNNKEYRWIPDETRMLEDFITIFRKENVDIISGWNITEFDIPYIVNRISNLGITKTLSPINEYYKNKHGQIEICGISDLDYIRLYRDKFEFDTKPSYALQAVGIAELNEGKIEYEGTISEAWKNDWDNFVDYNVQDVMLVKKLEDKKKYIELSVNIGFSSLIPFSKVFSTISMHTGYILSYFHSQNQVMPCRNKEPEEREIPGGFVYAETGLHSYMIEIDVESEYPHMIMQYNIGQESLRLDYDGPDSKDIQRTPLSEYKVWDTASGPIKWGGIYYDKSKKSVLSIIVKKIFDERKKFKRMQKLCGTKDPSKLTGTDLKLYEEIQKDRGTADYYDKMQHIRKIQINSLYGCLANKYFNLYNVNNAACITLSGQHFIKYARDCFNDYFKEKYNCTAPVVKLVDTDSNYISLDQMLKARGIKFANNTEACEWINNFIATELNPLIKRFVTAYAKFFDAPNIINFKSDKIILNYFIAGMKNYAMDIILADGKIYEEPKFKVMGIKTKKSDSSAFLKDTGTDVLKLILRGASKDKVNDFYRTMFKKFTTTSVENIAIPGKINDYNKWFPKSTEYYIKKPPQIPSKTPYRVKAGFFYNYFIKKNNIALMPISSGTKVKLVYVDPNNELRCGAIAFIGEWVEPFTKAFKPDYDKMWLGIETSVENWYKVMGWGKPQKIKNSFNSIFFKF